MVEFLQILFAAAITLNVWSINTSWRKYKQYKRLTRRGFAAVFHQRADGKYYYPADIFAEAAEHLNQDRRGIQKFLRWAWSSTFFAGVAIAFLFYSAITI
ncbi:hypothetical protein [Paenibacillus xylanexedens]|uniref:hypothetical protein n=1 Tax=Paenibacillus xylanexedens TaxID=528191 RepID=UPI00119E9D5D|nr:hypothetical protein [Paenibacillus xylanexedens]